MNLVYPTGHEPLGSFGDFNDPYYYGHRNAARNPVSANQQAEWRASNSGIGTGGIAAAAVLGPAIKVLGGGEPGVINGKSLDDMTPEERAQALADMWADARYYAYHGIATKWGDLNLTLAQDAGGHWHIYAITSSNRPMLSNLPKDAMKGVEWVDAAAYVYPGSSTSVRPLNDAEQIKLRVASDNPGMFAEVQGSLHTNQICSTLCADAEASVSGKPVSAGSYGSVNDLASPLGGTTPESYYESSTDSPRRSAVGTFSIQQMLQRRSKKLWTPSAVCQSTCLHPVKSAVPNSSTDLALRNRQPKPGEAPTAGQLMRRSLQSDR